MKGFYHGAAVALLLSLANTGFAGSCEIHFTRTACPGQEEISYKKCNGQQSCTEIVDAADAQACKTAAIQACENQRLNITKSKVISAKFGGTELKTDGGSTDFCTVYSNRAAEFDQCDK